MTTEFLQQPQGDLIELGKLEDHHRPAHIIDRPSVLAINAALATGRPLLVRGEPGVGKSQLARAAAVELRRPFRQYAVDASTEPRDLLYTVDAVARLARAQIAGALGEDRWQDLAVANFVRPGPLWWAFDWAGAAAQQVRANAAAQGRADLPTVASRPADGDTVRGAVLLIDEIDKADSAIPNALLDALGHRQFDVPGCDPVAMAGTRPLVVITTNEERSLPDAFLRRCFVLHLALPDDDGESALCVALEVRGAAHFPGCDPTILKKAAELIARHRLAMRRERLPAPGVAEYIDLVDAVLGQRAPGTDPSGLLDEVATFVLHKHAPAPRTPEPGA